MEIPSKILIIAGNGDFPILSAKEALKQGVEVFVAAIKGEAEKEIEMFAKECIWVGLGDFGKILSFLKKRNIKKIILAGQVKHVKIFSRDFPDFKTLKLLFSLKKNNTVSLLEGVISFLEREGFEVLDSTIFLRKFIPHKGILTKRRPSEMEMEDISFGYPIAKEISKLDIGQSIVVKNKAVVAVEAMEGTDETLLRANRLVGGKEIILIKVSRPNQDMRYDVPVLGLNTIKILKKCNVSTVVVEGEKTLILNLDKFLEELNKINTSLVVM